MNLFKANHQWSTRPPDERFSSLEEMLAACKGYADSAQEVEADPHALSVRASKTESGNLEPQLYGESGIPARLTNWSMKQLCSRAQFPHEAIAKLHPTLAADCLNWCLEGQRRETDRPVKLLLHSNGSTLLRALTGTGYQRFWNWRIAEGLMQLEQAGWRVPPARPAFPDQPGTRPATEADVVRGGQHGLSIRVGDLIAPAGLYASDHDMFAFMVNESRQIALPGSSGGLSRGFFVEHSEVGDSSYVVWLFLYESVCGNHIVWNARRVKELRIRHTGDALERISANLSVELRSYADASASEEEAKLKGLATLELGPTRESVIDLLFNRRLLARRTAELAYDCCEREQQQLDGSNPRTPWGMAQGLTRMSQWSAYADQRNELDRAAGKILEAF